MRTCPNCKGEKEFKIPSSHPLDVYSDEPALYETILCRTCEGAGKIHDLTCAVYKARGGPAPMQVKKSL